MSPSIVFITMNRFVKNVAATLIYEALEAGAGKSSPVAVDDEIPELANTPIIPMLIRKDGSVTYIVGSRESGKTTAAKRLAGLLGRPKYMISPVAAIPHGFEPLEFADLAKMPPPRSTLILDDMALYGNSKDNRDPLIRVLEELVPVVRHERKLHLICISQVSSLVDKHVMDADCVLFKKPSPLFEATERPAMVKYYKRIAKLFRDRGDFFAKRHAYAVTIDDWSGMVRIDRG